MDEGGIAFDSLDSSSSAAVDHAGEFRLAARPGSYFVGDDLVPLPPRMTLQRKHQVLRHGRSLQMKNYIFIYVTLGTFLVSSVTD